MVHSGAGRLCDIEDVVQKKHTPPSRNHLLVHPEVERVEGVHCKGLQPNSNHIVVKQWISVFGPAFVSRSPKHYIDGKSVT